LSRSDLTVRGLLLRRSCEGLRSRSIAPGNERQPLPLTRFLVVKVHSRTLLPQDVLYLPSFRKRGNSNLHGYHRHQPTDMNTGFLSLPKSIEYV
jgi:hypothetical protein